jgi:hypothetical protein
MSKDLFSYSNTENKRGTFKLIDTKDLHIPEESYQRCATTAKKVTDIAKNWDWLLCGTLTVIPSKNGKFDVVDGGHRLRGAIENGKVGKLPCMVFSIENTKNAAKGFVGIQRLRTAVKSMENHKADLLAGNPVAEQAEKIIKDSGYATGRSDSKGNWKFDAISTLYRLIEIDKDVADYAMTICSDIANGDRIYNHVLNGVFQVELRTRQLNMKTLYDNTAMTKLKKEGILGIVQAINKVKVMCGKNSVGFGRTMPAMGVLAVINKGKKRHINLFSSTE